MSLPVRRAVVGAPIPRVQVRLFGHWHDAAGTPAGVDTIGLIAACERWAVPMRRYRPRATAYGPARPVARRASLAYRVAKLAARGCALCHGSGDLAIPSLAGWDHETIYCGCRYGRILGATDARGHRAYLRMAIR